MMRTKMIQSIAVIGMLAIAIASCKSTKKSDTTTENVMVSAVSKPVGKDTITIKNIRRVQRDSLGLFAVVFDVPTSGSDIMKNAITEWISEELEGSYEGELTDVEKMADYYMDKVLKRNYETASEFKAESGQDQLNYEDSTTINKFYESDAFITYSYVSDGYTGGAHGYHIYKGQTFRKSDGRRIGWDVFQRTYSVEFMNLIRDGLKEYWEVKTDEELDDMLMDKDNFSVRPLPDCPPLFEKKGVTFVYNQYEIAPYAAGLPSFTIPYEKLVPFMNATAKKLIK